LSKSDAARPDQKAESLAACYRLVARLLASEMDADTLEILQHESVLSVLAIADPDSTSYLTQPWGAAQFELVQADFCALFILQETAILPRPAAWLAKGTDNSPEGIHAVAAAFLEAGEITLPECCHALPYDHISVLLSIAAALYQVGSEQAEEFEQQTLHPWAGKFARSLEQCSSPLYRSVGALLRSVI
jgi:TorA maturation chaperone TorD